VLTPVISVIIGGYFDIEQCSHLHRTLRDVTTKWYSRPSPLRGHAHFGNSLSDLRNGEPSPILIFSSFVPKCPCPRHSGARARCYFGRMAPPHGSADTTFLGKRCPRAMNRSLTSRLTLSKIQVSPHAYDSSVPARCYASGTNFFVIAVAGCRKPRSGAFCQLWFFRRL
jgi:hypothetical protein